MSDRARFIMVGGFLGSGKTTSLGRLAGHFTDAGKRVGLITNDQAEGLVDTLNLRSQGFSVEEIAGGCFCCRFNSLTEAADKLSAIGRPDIFLGEPVGSCTDLLATVAIPMKKLYGDRFDVAPLTVLVDPIRAKKILTHQKRGGFSPKVSYIYRKQLEEADAVVINKSDLLDETETANLARLIEENYPDTQIFTFSARELDGMDNWFEYVSTQQKDWTETMDVDYDTYADGEAELGWLNSSCKVTSDSPFDPNQLLTDIAEGVKRRVQKAGGEIAHFKMTLMSGMDIGFVSLVANDAVPELSQEIRNHLGEAEITLNGRAQIAPESLQQFSEEAVAEASAAQNVSYEFLSVQAFRPARPEPVHRMNPTTTS